MSESAVLPSFSELGLSDAVVAALTDVGYETPTPIQAQTIPALLGGADLLGQAQTGTGKTAAFALPILSKIDVELRATQALVLAPTRELAIQVAEAFQKYAAKMPGFHVLPIYGGQSYTPQLKGLKRGAHVVVGTPGRVAGPREERRARRSSTSSSSCSTKATRCCRWASSTTSNSCSSRRRKKSRWRCSPRRCRTPSAASRRRTCAIRARSACSRVAKPRRRSASATGWSAACTSSTRSRACSSPRRFDAMLVFVRTKIETVDLAQRLEARGFAASALNGDMEQRQREQMVTQLKNGKIDILIATDVAARGLDVERISHVLNYDIPYDSETYVHRIGRTGRAGRTGDAILFVSPRERNMLRVIERVTKQQLEEMKMPSVADVNELRVVKFKEKITAAVMSGAGKEFQSMLEQVQSEGDIPAIEIAAALASMVQGSTPLFLAQKPESEQPKAPPRIDGSVPTQTYRIEVGHAHGVLPGNIVGAIANEAGIEGKNIGHIDIREDHSYVDLPGLPDEMMASLQDVRVRGEAIRIQRVDSKPDKPKFSGQSRRPDRMAEEDGGRRPYAGGGGKRYDKSGPPSGEKRPYTGGGNRFDKAGEPRPFESRRSESRNYKVRRAATRARRASSATTAPRRPGGERPSFDRSKAPRVRELRACR